MKRLTIQIDRKHTEKLLRGETIAFRVPEDDRVVQLRLADMPRALPDTLSKLCDVFFNGRPA